MALITIYQYRVVTRSLLIFSGALGDIERVREGAARIPRLTAREQPSQGLVMTCCCQDPSACFIVPQRLVVSTPCHYFLFLFLFQFQSFY